MARRVMEGECALACEDATARVAVRAPSAMDEKDILQGSDLHVGGSVRRG